MSSSLVPDEVLVELTKYVTSNSGSYISDVKIRAKVEKKEGRAKEDCIKEEDRAKGEAKENCDGRTRGGGKRQGRRCARTASAQAEEDRECQSE